MLQNKGGKKNILLIGPIPPPTGGVSIHINRLAKLIENDFSIDFIDESHNAKSDYFNLRSLNIIRYLIKIINADLIYIHSGKSLLRIFHITFGRMFSKKIIITLHAYPVLKKNIKKSFDEFFFNWANKIVVVNSDMLKNITLPPEKCLIIHAFLPPILEKEFDLPNYVNDWIIAKKKLGRIIICSNASRLDIYNDQDLYGLDMCLDVALRLIEKNYPISFIYNVSSLERNNDLYQKYHESLQNMNIQNNFLLISEELSFVNLIKQSDIVLRPTNTDGDALTVREALYLQKPVIASDVVNRPSGTILFKSRDLDDLEIKLMEELIHRNNITVKPLKDYKNTYHQFYKELIEKTINKE